MRRYVCLLVAAACGGERATRSAPQAQPPIASPEAVPVPPDSLVLRTAGDAEVWFTLARTARDSAGRPCVERGLEIRTGGRRMPVPLLYTRDIPRVLDDSTVRARLWGHCAPGPGYRVNLKTGQPVREAR